MPVRRCVFCRSILRDDRERCGTCGRYRNVMQNDLEFVEEHVERRVDLAFQEGRAEKSILNELIDEGFPPELFEDRLRELAIQRRRTYRRWGLGQIATGSLFLLVGVGMTVGIYLATGKIHVFSIAAGLILLGAATLGRGLQAIFFRD